MRSKIEEMKQEIHLQNLEISRLQTQLTGKEAALKGIHDLYINETKRYKRCQQIAESWGSTVGSETRKRHDGLFQAF